MKKNFVLAMLSLMFVFSAARAAEGVSVETKNAQRASDEKVQLLLEKIQGLKAANTPDHCDEEPQYRCAQRCESRWSDGTCSRYGRDYCGYYANCVAPCQSRFSDGTCNRYGADFCGPHAQCIENCVSRRSDGVCTRYEQDLCF